LFNNKKNNILIENLLDGIIFLNLNLEILVINNQALKILNWKSKIVDETTFLNNFNFSIKRIFLEKIKELLLKRNYSKSKNYKEILIYYKKPNKKMVLFIIKIGLKKNKVIGIVLLIKDISKKIFINKKKMLFLSNISHELRTPLFNIQSFIQTLENSLKFLKQEEILDFLNITNKEIIRLNRLVNTIISVSNFNYKNTYSFLPVYIKDIFNSFIQIYSIRLKEKKIKIITEVEEKLASILAEKDLILQVFDNLIGNAIKFSKKNSLIVFRAYSISNSKTKKVRLEIGDYGIGITKSLQKNIFYEFSKLNDEIKNIYGNGLGLSITKKILQKQKSSIFFTSEKNEGIIFFFDFEIIK
jgi:two-component system, OmpR family, sensor histidine kinase NblS